MRKDVTGTRRKDLLGLDTVRNIARAIGAAHPETGARAERRATRDEKEVVGGSRERADESSDNSARKEVEVSVAQAAEIRQRRRIPPEMRTSRRVLVRLLQRQCEVACRAVVKAAKAETFVSQRFDSQISRTGSELEDAERRHANNVPEGGNSRNGRCERQILLRVDVMAADDELEAEGRGRRTERVVRR
jgi:hypothetical protein